MNKKTTMMAAKTTKMTAKIVRTKKYFKMAQMVNKKMIRTPKSRLQTNRLISARWKIMKTLPMRNLYKIA